MVREFYDEILAQRIKANGGIHDVLVLNHSNDVGGTTYFDDGSVIYWGEKSMVGESPTLVVNGVAEGGERVEMDLQTLEDFGYGFATEYFLNGPSQNAEVRMMTPEEEAQWDMAFHGPTDR